MSSILVTNSGARSPISTTFLSEVLCIATSLSTTMHLMQFSKLGLPAVSSKLARSTGRIILQLDDFVQTALSAPKSLRLVSSVISPTTLMLTMHIGILPLPPESTMALEMTRKEIKLRQDREIPPLKMTFCMSLTASSQRPTRSSLLRSRPQRMS
jgi:hypothetical protein